MARYDYNQLVGRHFIKPVTLESTEYQGDTKRVRRVEGRLGFRRRHWRQPGCAGHLQERAAGRCILILKPCGGSDIFQLLAVRGCSLHLSPAWLCNEMGPNKAAPAPMGAHPS